MNFPHFGGHFPTNLPTLHQFAAKFSQENVTNTLCATQDNSRYTANGIPSVTQHHPATQQQLLNAGKYHGSYINNHSYIQHGNSIHGNNSTNGPNIRITEKKQLLNYDQQELTQELCAVILQQQQNVQEKLNEVVEKTNNKETHHQNTTAALRPQQSLQETLNVINTAATAPSTSSWQTALTSGSSVADYLSHLPTSTLPLSLQHFLKFSADSLKKESNNGSNLNQNSNVILQTAQNNVSTVNLNSILSNNNNSSSNNVQNTVNNHQSSVGLSSLSTINTAQLHSHTNPNGNTVVKKKKKKKVEKEKKPRPKPGEIRLTTALDGSTLYCCPECHMAYPEKELLEQHLVGHTMERRFVCDICGAGLKRKDHLTRHKQSHNPERPFVCTVCLKAFKRKEQLTLHFVIHSGEKRHICTECGKGFYRKDHLRKHTRSHIARRVKAELSQQGSNNGVGLGLQNNGSATSSGELKRQRWASLNSSLNSSTFACKL